MRFSANPHFLVYNDIFWCRMVNTISPFPSCVPSCRMKCLRHAPILGRMDHSIAQRCIAQMHVNETRKCQTGVACNLRLHCTRVADDPKIIIQKGFFYKPNTTSLLQSSIDPSSSLFSYWNTRPKQTKQTSHCVAIFSFLHHFS